MFKIKNNQIFITRGNSGQFSIQVSDKNGTPYNLVDGDSLLFSVKKGCDYQEILIQKDTYTIDFKTVDKRTVNSYVFKIEPEDTSELEFGNYVYDVILYFTNGDVNTVVDASLFRICRGVGS